MEVRRQGEWHPSFSIFLPALPRVGSSSVPASWLRGLKQFHCVSSNIPSSDVWAKTFHRTPLKFWGTEYLDDPFLKYVNYKCKLPLIQSPDFWEPILVLFVFLSLGWSCSLHLNYLSYLLLLFSLLVSVNNSLY